VDAHEGQSPVKSSQNVSFLINKFLVAVGITDVKEELLDGRIRGLQVLGRNEDAGGGDQSDHIVLRLAPEVGNPRQVERDVLSLEVRVKSVHTVVEGFRLHVQFVGEFAHPEHEHFSVPNVERIGTVVVAVALVLDDLLEDDIHWHLGAVVLIRVTDRLTGLCLSSEATSAAVAHFLGHANGSDV